MRKQTAVVTACVLELFFSSDFGCGNRTAHVGKKTHAFSTTSESPGVRTNANNHDSPVCNVYDKRVLACNGMRKQTAVVPAYFLEYFFFEEQKPLL